MSEHIRTSRPLVTGRGGAVASGHPLASAAGLDMLRRGGSAADAAVATAAVLAVVEPQMSGLHGDGFFLVRETDGKATVFNATGPAPRAASVETFGGHLPRRGAASASVPGLVDGWITLHARYGRLPFYDLLQPAITCAREGFPASQRLCAFVAQDADELRRDPMCTRIFFREGELPRTGDLLVQTELGRTLDRLARHGRDDFYEGETARALTEFCQAQGGAISLDDLREFHTELQAPIATTYRGYTVLEAPPNSTGHVLLQELNIVEQFDLSDMEFLSARHVHTLVEAKKLAFADREAFSGDPRSVDIPLEQLLSKDRARRQAERINPSAAAQLPLAAGAPSGSGDTTYFAVVDTDGLAISAIQSLNQAWGAATIDPRTGILLNNRMLYWHLEPGHPNQLAPGKRVRHTMNPPMVLRDGKLVLVFGTPGADQQVQVNLQVLTGIIDFGLDPQEAVEMPRWRSFQPGGESDWPHGVSSNLLIENRMPAATLRMLESFGHTLDIVGPLEGGCNVQAIMVHPDHGTLLAASDPRRDGYALAL
ncbi:MAG: gamma-glutamyltransferase [Chloroflexota bacterium]